MPKCIAGDLAVIVYAYNTVNIGTIVRCLMCIQISLKFKVILPMFYGHAKQHIP